MFKTAMACAACALMAVTALSAQTKKPAAAGKSIVHDVTITTDGGSYTGTMDLAVKGGKVSGTIHITQPTEVTGKVAGTVKGPDMVLDFPYRMVQRGCDGTIGMKIKLSDSKAGVPPKSTGTVSIGGCGRAPGDLLPGTIQLTPKK